MSKFLVFILFAPLMLVIDTTQTIPTELVGEWASEASEFNGGPISKGTAVYVGTNGFAAIISAPPPIGAKGSATYNAKKRVLTITMINDGKQIGPYDFTYDRKSKTLRSRKGEFGNEPFARRRDRIPKHVLEEFKQ